MRRFPRRIVLAAVVVGGMTTLSAAVGLAMVTDARGAMGSRIAFPTAARDTGWLTTKWQVSCAPDMKQLLDEEAYNVECSDTDIVGVAAATRGELERASAWLQGLGFYGPLVTMAGTADSASEVKYYAEISDARMPSLDVSGLYDPASRQLVVNGNSFIGIGTGQTQEEAEDALERSSGSTVTMVHELFHAVQHAYAQKHGYSEAYYGTAADWIFEGTAEAIKAAWLFRDQPPPFTTQRAYDYPLHEPRVDVVDGKPVCMDCYRTRVFWYDIGTYIDSPDRVQYLHSLLSQDLGINRGIDGVDAALRTWDPDGLYNLYPEFIRQRATHGGYFRTVKQIDLSWPAQKAARDENAAARPVAANAYELTVSVPQDSMATLEIRLATDKLDLHLIVDGERLDMSEGPTRNVFRTTLTGNSEASQHFVRVANVAEQPGSSRDQQYTLEFVLQSSPECSFDATLTGGYAFHAAAENTDLRSGTWGTATAVPNGTREGGLQAIYLEAIRINPAVLGKSNPSAAEAAAAVSTIIDLTIWPSYAWGPPPMLGTISDTPALGTAPDEPIPVGATGSFPANVDGYLQDEEIHVGSWSSTLYTPEQQPHRPGTGEQGLAMAGRSMATLTITEHTPEFVEGVVTSPVKVGGDIEEWQETELRVRFRALYAESNSLGEAFAPCQERLRQEAATTSP